MRKIGVVIALLFLIPTLVSAKPKDDDLTIAQARMVLLRDECNQKIAVLNKTALTMVEELKKLKLPNVDEVVNKYTKNENN